jgi:hypothetical protein
MKDPAKMFITIFIVGLAFDEKEFSRAEGEIVSAKRGVHVGPVES